MRCGAQLVPHWHDAQPPEGRGSPTLVVSVKRMSIAASVWRRHLRPGHHAPTIIGGYGAPLNRAGPEISGLADTTTAKSRLISFNRAPGCFFVRRGNLPLTMR